MDEMIIRDYAQELSQEGAMYCSFQADSPENKAKLINAMNNPDYRVGDCINQEINLTDVFCQTVECRNEETGEVSVAPRVVLIDDKGKAYQSVSVGIYSSLKNIMFVYGDPSTWEKPVKVKITQITKGKNKMLNLKVVG